jgi:anti-sigma factor RsiW
VVAKLPDLPDRGPHDEAEELLPWYATGQLDSADRARVERHIYACADCREQLILERRLIEQYQATSPQIESGWARLKAQIAPPPPVSAPRPSMLGELWSLLSRPAVATLAVAQLAFVVVAGSVLLSLSRPDYHALGSAPEPASANAIIMFRAEASAQDVRDTLDMARASIVDGPTSAGAYLIHVNPATRAAVLTKLQADDDVQLAQPVDGASR